MTKNTNASSPATRIASAVFTIGPKFTPFDLRKWNRHCVKKIGRKVAMGNHMSRDELMKLGFPYAAGVLPTRLTGYVGFQHTLKDRNFFER